MTNKINVDAALAELENGSVPQWIAEHLRVYVESGGREGHLWDSTPAGGPGLLPCLLLTTKGKRSGSPRVAPLIYGEVDGAYVIVASKGGAPESPGWYHNLVAQPEVTIQVGQEVFGARAREADGDHRAKLWNHMVVVYPPYREYQDKTARLIPVVELVRA
ncbi:MAG: nitroreductase family deazaflavin-dependent oxidoreductase [Pseudomonadota bacterium]